MLERSLFSAGISLLICCWLSASPAEGRTAGQSAPDSGKGSAPHPSDSLVAADSANRTSAAPVSADSGMIAPAPSRPSPAVRTPGSMRGPFPGSPLLLQAPLSDLPYGFKGGFDSPSMRQSMLWNTSSIQLANQTIGWLWEGRQPGFLRYFGTWASLGLFTYASVYLPPGGAWMHEEWHRAVLTKEGVSSYNGVYHWDIGAEAIAVDHVEDAELAEMKADHPADFIRLMSAGLESETESVRLMRRNNFFLGRRSEYDLLSWWNTNLNGAAYLYICSVKEFDETLKEANFEEEKMSERDFTGLDFRAWVHDLRRPEEPYAQGPRGRIHPTGSGVDRYLLYSDLTPDERNYLRLQAGLSLLNLVSPQSIGRDWLPGVNPWDGGGFLWNFGLSHHLTPFGFDVGGDFLVRRGKWSWVVSMQGLINGEMALPAMAGELFRYPVPVGRSDIYLTCGASAWLQPENQLHYTSSVAPGGAVLLGLAVPLQYSLELFAEADAKTEGWMPGNVYLDAAVQGRAGLQLKL
jgi:hypothetical protein